MRSILWYLRREKLAAMCESYESTTNEEIWDDFGEMWRGEGWIDYWKVSVFFGDFKAEKRSMKSFHRLISLGEFSKMKFEFGSFLEDF